MCHAGARILAAVDDLAPDTISLRRLIHLPLLTLLGALTFAIGVLTDPYELTEAFGVGIFMLLTKSLLAAIPVYFAVKGGRAWAIFARSLVAMLVLAMSVALVPDGVGRGSWLDRMATSAYAAAFLTPVGFVFVLPVIWLAQHAVARPRERNVANESLVLAVYGLICVASTSTHLAAGTDHVDELYRDQIVTVTTLLMRLTALATIGIAAVGVAWESRFRRRVRAVIADEVPGWRVKDAKSPEGVPRLSWLAWASVLEPWMTRPIEMRVIVRAPRALPEGGYRDARDDELAWACVPLRVPPIGERSIAMVGVAFATLLMCLR